MTELKIKVGGMNCNHCKINVETGLKRVSGIDYALVDIINGDVKIKGSNLDPDIIKTAIEDLGYFYDGIIQ